MFRTGLLQSINSEKLEEDMEYFHYEYPEFIPKWLTPYLDYLLEKEASDSVSLWRHLPIVTKPFYGRKCNPYQEEAFSGHQLLLQKHLRNLERKILYKYIIQLYAEKKKAMKKDSKNFWNDQENLQIEDWITMFTKDQDSVSELADFSPDDRLIHPEGAQFCQIIGPIHPSLKTEEAADSNDPDSSSKERSWIKPTQSISQYLIITGLPTRSKPKVTDKLNSIENRQVLPQFTAEYELFKNPSNDESMWNDHRKFLDEDSWIMSQDPITSSKSLIASKLFPYLRRRKISEIYIGPQLILSPSDLKPYTIPEFPDSLLDLILETFVENDAENSIFVQFNVPIEIDVNDMKSLQQSFKSNEVYVPDYLFKGLNRKIIQYLADCIFDGLEYQSYGGIDNKRLKINIPSEKHLLRIQGIVNTPTKLPRWDFFVEIGYVDPFIPLESYENNNPDWHYWYLISPDYDSSLAAKILGFYDLEKRIQVWTEEQLLLTI